MQQDELARLFAQNLTFAPPANQPTPPPEDTGLSTTGIGQPKHSEPITYITQHYTHSAHVVAARPPPEQVSTPPSHAGPALERELLDHGISPGLLFPSQLALFGNADQQQRARLVELWRICPPSLDEHQRARASGDWQAQTDLQREEALTRARFEHQQHIGHEWQRQQHLRPQQAEPYMLSGYEALARREYEEEAAREVQHQQQRYNDSIALQETTRYNQATDRAYYKPAISGGGHLFAPAGDGAQDMENQYGAFEAARHAEVAAPADEDMVM